MLLEEYNETQIMELFREEGREEGRMEGREEGREEGRVEILTNIFNSQKNGIITLEQAAAIAGMTVDEFQEKMRVK